MKKQLITYLILLVSVILTAQDGSLDTSFNPTDIGFGDGDGIDQYITNTVIQNDGKILISGPFNKYNGVESKFIARLNNDGSSDTSFNVGSGTNHLISTIAIQTDGKIIIGGDFTSYNGVESNYIARLNTNGSLDTSFNIGTGANSGVYTLAIQTDGKIVIGGNFTSYNGVESNYVARLNTNGSLDTSFNVESNIINSISTLVIQTNGKIVIGGSQIARLNVDGSLDTSLNRVVGLHSKNPKQPSSIYKMVLQDDGKIIIGGYFKIDANDRYINSIARLDSNGVLDTEFNVGSGADGSVSDITIQDDGKILIGGYFESYNDNLSNNIARLNSNGVLDTEFNIGNGVSGDVAEIVIQDDGKIFMVGRFKSYNDRVANNMVRIDSGGVFDAEFNMGSGANASVFDIAIQEDEKIIIGGVFTKYNRSEPNNIARLNNDGSLDTSFNTVKGTLVNSGVQVIVIQDDEKILIGGYRLNYNGDAITGIVRLNNDGNLDTSFNPGTVVFEESNVYTIIIQDDGKILISGDFYDGTSYYGVVRLNNDGSLDTSFNLGLITRTETVRTMVIQDDGKIIVGGLFLSYNGSLSRGIARLNSDGSLDTSFNAGTGINGSIRILTIQDDGKILVGGSFSTYNGVESNDILRLNSDGSLDSSFNSGTGAANSGISEVVIQGDGKILICGFFSGYNGSLSRGIARLNSDGSLDSSFNSGTGTNEYIYGIAIQSEGKIIIGGDFTSYDNIGRNRIARINTSVVLSTKDNQINSSKILIYSKKDVLSIKNTKGIIASINIFDVTGKLLYEDKDVNHSELQIPNFNIKNELLILKVTDSDNIKTTKKIVME